MRLVILLLLTLSLYSAERIVTLSPALGEIVSGLKAGEDIVGVSDYSLYPSRLTSLPHIGGYTTLSLEKTLSLRPSLVIGLPYQKPFLKKVAAFGVETLTLQLESIAEIKKAIELIAKRVHRVPEARYLLQTIDQAIQNAPQSKDEESVLIVFANASALTRGVYVAGHDLFFEEILAICHNKNAYSDTYGLQPVLSVENIIAANPSHVILLLGPLDQTDPNAIKKEWEALPIQAATNHKVTVIQNDYILIPSQRINKTITTLCKVLQ